MLLVLRVPWPRFGGGSQGSTGRALKYVAFSCFPSTVRGAVWGGSAGWCAQTAPTLLLPLPTARICVRQVQLIHSLVRLIVFFAQQGGRVFSFSMSLKKQGISFRLFCRVLGVAPHVRSPKDYVRAQFSGFRLRYFLNFSTKMLNLKPENSASTMGFSELTM